MAIPRVLVIAGSDSSGGAGLEADQKVLAAHGCYAMTATTALTAQNTLGVEDVHITPPEFVAKQIDKVMEDIGCDVAKIGMLASEQTIWFVADRLFKHSIQHVVLDPVMVATSGAQLLPGDAVHTLRKLLIPGCTILTPNIPEATLLLKHCEVELEPPLNLDDLKLLAKRVWDYFRPQAVLLKGGHLPLTSRYTKATADADKARTVDVLYEARTETFTIIESPYLSSKNTHGTGCSLASAIAAHLARQVSSSPQPSTVTLDLPSAVRSAVRYVTTGIQYSDTLALPSRGAGPIAHFHTLQHLPFSRGHFIEYLLGHPLVAGPWHRYIHHDFPTQLALGTLDPRLFKNYLVQDYLYLTHFARSHSLAAYKSRNMAAITASATIVLHIHREMELHLRYCAEFGISREQLEDPGRRESLACVAYSRYVLDEGASGDWMALQMALAPCLLGYGMVAERLMVLEGRREEKDGNKLWRWAENYAADDYKEAVRVGRALIEDHIYKQSASRVEELVRIFVRATEMEVRFWDFDAHPEDIDIPEGVDGVVKTDVPEGADGVQNIDIPKGVDGVVKTDIPEGADGVEKNEEQVS